MVGSAISFDHDRLGSQFERVAAISLLYTERGMLARERQTYLHLPASVLSFWVLLFMCMWYACVFMHAVMCVHTYICECICIYV